MRRVFFCIVLLCIGTAEAARGATDEPSRAPQESGNGSRVAAEWEPAVGVLIGWPLKLPKSLVVELAKDVDLYVTVADKGAEEKARATFKDWGIAPKRTHFLITKQGDGYFLTRDWGPSAVFDGRGKCKLVDGRYIDYPVSGIDSGKRMLWLSKLVDLDYRPDDDAPAAVAKALGLPRTELSVALTGGNLLFDGQGTAFATQILVDENATTGTPKEKLLRVLREELGVTRFHVLPNFESAGYEGLGFGIQHVDCLLKLLDEERILVKRVPKDHPDFEYIEAAVGHLAKLKSASGRPYTLLRIDTPRYHKDYLANYTNSLILNRKVYVPLFGIPADKEALETWRAALPGYEVLGFEFDRGEDGWSYTDSLHCRTRAIWDQKMLHMTHRRVGAPVARADKQPIEVHIRDYSGAGLIEDKLELVWRTEGSTEWTRVRLEPAAGAPTTFEASIGGLRPGQVVEYYLSAASRSGRQESLPRTAPKGCYSFKVAEKR
jgi:agmatine/peptidylarginine deiminase